jgi:hypothetical protein
MTKRDFLKSEAARAGVTVSWLARIGLHAQPCDHRPTQWTPSGEKPTGPCAEDDCSGWKLVMTS